MKTSFSSYLANFATQSEELTRKEASIQIEESRPELREVEEVLMEDLDDLRVGDPNRFS